MTLNEFSAYIDKLIELAKEQGRDRIITSRQWGNRDTLQNWTMNAWRFIKEFQMTTALQIAGRTTHDFSITGFNQFGRGISEFSTSWASETEENIIRSYIARLATLSRYIDLTLDKFSTNSLWNDFTLFKAWLHFEHRYVDFPKLQIREDIVAETNTVPPKTGVYISATDPNASLQFSWVSNKHGKLLFGRTFSQLGLDALDYIGRDNLWADGENMLQFVLANKNHAVLKEDAFFSDSQTPLLAPSLIARSAFATCSGKWFFVELVDDKN